MKFSYHIFTFFFVIVALGCSPAFETTAEICASNEDAAVRVTVDDFVVDANEVGSDYVLYLEDILNALVLASGEPALAVDDQMALDEILAIINHEDFLNYQLDSNGVVVSATNPLDFMENLIATTDDSKVIDAFSQAKKQIADGIAANDGFCIYTNRNIQISNLDSSIQLFAELFMSYSPFSEITQTSVAITESVAALTDLLQRAEAPYFGFVQTSPDNFTSSGYSQPLIRQAIMNNPELTETLIVDDDFDVNLGQVEFSTADTYCDRDNPSNDINDFAICSAGIITRPVVKTAQCSGGVDSEGEDLIDEVDKIEVRSFDLNSSVASLSNLKRFRVETDFPASEARIYVSEYNEAIFDSDGTTVIKDPTNCEKQAVLDELAILTPGVGVRLTVVPDPDFDIDYVVDAEGERVQDANGDDIIIEPIPAFSYTGVSIPSRI